MAHSTDRKLTWLVTGSSNGFGLALTRQILASGHNVIATSRNPAKTPDLVKEVGSSDNGRWLRLDVTWSQDQLSSAIREANSLFREGIDVLVNNAGFSVLGAVEDVPEEQAKAGFEANFWGPIRLCKAVIPLMRERRRGTIVNVSSAVGLTTWAGLGMYSATKFALESVSQTLASELSDFGVRVLIVEPGAFRTNFLAGGAMQVAEPSESYQKPHVVGQSLQDEYDKNGKQPGDADKAVKVIFDVVTGKIDRLQDILRLPLGSDCWQAGIDQVNKVKADFEKSREVAMAVGYDDA